VGATSSKLKLNIVKIRRNRSFEEAPTLLLPASRVPAGFELLNALNRVSKNILLELQDLLRQLSQKSIDLDG